MQLKPSLATAKLKLNGFTFEELFQVEGLLRLDKEFLAKLQSVDKALHHRLLAYRKDGKPLSPLEVSELLLACAPIVEEFIADLFGIKKAVDELRRQTLAHDPIFQFKKHFIQREARRRSTKNEQIETFQELNAWLEKAIAKNNLQQHDPELGVALLGQHYLAEGKKNKQEIELLTRWCIRAMTSPEGRTRVQSWVSFHLPQRVDYKNLVSVRPVTGDPVGRIEGPMESRRRRDGFKLTDTRMSPREVQNEINYCIYCHDHDGDFCSKGFPEKKGEPEKGLKINPLGVTLTGCPLDEKVSEMHKMKQQGLAIAALAVITVDNPMCAATGHRICNDCMKGCIYQKQDPVNIPQAETGILTDVLALPWGVEIYDLLIRWNPLRPAQWLPKSYNGLKVLIAGMGPAGFTLAHHLLMEGFAVVGTEGLKIEPLPRGLVTQPIRDYADLHEDLDTRVMTGFGGVAEYGITNRWDKNFLKLIYISLMRRTRFQVFGGVRFGGTIAVEDAWELGFDHLAIAVGAGLPQALPIPGSLAPGMRQANDFLMALQLTGAAKASSLANLQMRLPAVIIGGGLTGVDTATEVQAYYIMQVEKTLARYEILAETVGDAAIRNKLDSASLEILDEFLEHGRRARTERMHAKTEGHEPDFLPLIRQWGGVTIAYRRGMNESPAYLRNHEEISKAFEEGIYYLEGVEPKEARKDRHGYVESLVCRRRVRDEDGKWRATDEEVVLPARSILVATGARPNVAYEFEHRGHFTKEKGHYQTYREVDQVLAPMPVAPHCKAEDFGAFTSYTRTSASNSDKSRRVSFIGDTHPVFHGSVVKAIASGRRVYPKIVASMGDRARGLGEEKEYLEFRAHMESLLQTRIETVQRLTENVVEIRVRAPMAAKKFRPGQFFRIQNFETTAPIVAGTNLQTEALALTGAGIDKENGCISLLIYELGGSARVCATLRKNNPVTLMGPTGVRAKIPTNGETVLVVTNLYGTAHIRALGPALRAKGNQVLLFATYQTAAEVHSQDELEHAADCIVWCTAEGTPIKVRRSQDRAASGDTVDILTRYAQGKLDDNDKEPPIRLQKVDRILVVGGSGLVRRIRDARHAELQNYLSKQPPTTASISTPMQCMLKGVCSQCLQWQIDPKTGKRTKAVFGCSWQDQPLDIVDLDNLDERLSQNRLQERLSNLWLDYLFAQNKVTRI